MECYSVDMRDEIADGGVLVARWDSPVDEWCFLIVREIHNLTNV